MIDNSLGTQTNLDHRAISLKATKTANLVIEKVTRVLSLLLMKRATLAQRAIQAELLLFARLEALLIASLTKSLADGAGTWDVGDCRRLRLVNSKLNKQLRAFLKAAAYDFNYLEQYFEHDFWLELKNNKFAEQLTELEKNNSLGIAERA